MIKIKYFSKVRSASLLIFLMTFNGCIPSCISKHRNGDPKPVSTEDYSFWYGETETWSSPELDSNYSPYMPASEIGYTKMQINLPSGRHANFSSSRFVLLNTENLKATLIGDHLAVDENTNVRFSGWSPDGSIAVVEQRFNTPENAAWEEANKQKNIEPHKVDTYLYKVELKIFTDISSVERVSNYNTGVIFWPGDTSKLAFTPIIEGKKQAYSMNIDGTNKQNLSDNSGYAYGLNISPDGDKVAYQNNYQLNIYNTVSKETKPVTTNNLFNFMPQWSNDSSKIVFISGPSKVINGLYIVDSNGSNLSFLASRGRSDGTFPLLDVFDFHGGSSEVPKWSPDDKFIYYTRKIDDKVEIMKISIQNKKIYRLTNSNSGVTNYDPTPSPDGKWILFGTKEGKKRFLKVMYHDGQGQKILTSFPEGYGGYWPKWRP